MTTQDLTAANFETHRDRARHRPRRLLGVLVWALCRQFAPTYDKAAAANPDIVFGKVDTEAERTLAGAAGIISPDLDGNRATASAFSPCCGASPRSGLDQVITARTGNST